jgi:dTDP-4-dehydrorhamnose reductase
MKILLFGKDGQLGNALQHSLAPLGEVVALSRTSADLCGDLDNFVGIAATVHSVAPQIIVNAAAYTAVDRAETERIMAHRINALAPGILAQAAEKCAALLVHYSTDYVFNGVGVTPWVETDAPAPVNYYGVSKLAGERAIQASGCRHLILRTSWLYAAHGNNFLKTILRLAAERSRLTIVDDQIGAPTGANLVATVTAQTLQQVLRQPENCGLYHLAASGAVSWCEYARVIVDFARQMGMPCALAADSLVPIPAREYVTLAQRPYNSRLNTTKICQTFGLNLPPWQLGVRAALRELMPETNGIP